VLRFSDEERRLLTLGMLNALVLTSLGWIFGILRIFKTTSQTSQNAYLKETNLTQPAPTVGFPEPACLLACHICLSALSTCLCQ
jgi:hypothetical protein